MRNGPAELPPGRILGFKPPCAGGGSETEQVGQGIDHRLIDRLVGRALQRCVLRRMGIDSVLRGLIHRCLGVGRVHRRLIRRRLGIGRVRRGLVGCRLGVVDVLLGRGRIRRDRIGRRLSVGRVHLGLIRRRLCVGRVLCCLIGCGLCAGCRRMGRGRRLHRIPICRELADLRVRGCVGIAMIVRMRGVQRAQRRGGLAMAVFGPRPNTVCGTDAIAMAMAMAVAGAAGSARSFGAATIAVAVTLSSINALTLSPALCATILKPPSQTRRGPLAWFEKGLNTTRNGFNVVVRLLIRRAVVSAAAVVVVIGATLWFGLSLPTGFIPPEDRGAFFVDVRLPDGAALPRTAAVLAEVEKILSDNPGVANVISVGGYSLLQGTVLPNGAFVIAVLKPWDERTAPELHLRAIMSDVAPKFAAISRAMIIPFVPPPIPGLGSTGGFEFVANRNRYIGAESAVP